MKKSRTKISFAGLMLVIFLMTSITTFAYVYIYNMDSSKWKSDSYYAGYWEEQPYVYFHDVTPGFTGMGYMSNAVLTWNNAGFPVAVTTVPANSSIDFYSGTASQLIVAGFAYNSTTAGLTLLTGKTLMGGEGYNYGLTPSHRNIYKLTEAKTSFRSDVTVPSGCTLTGCYYNLSLHELGHAMGWIGHRSLDLEVMWPSVTNITSLSANEIGHLEYIYSLADVYFASSTADN